MGLLRPARLISGFVFVTGGYSIFYNCGAFLPVSAGWIDKSLQNPRKTPEMDANGIWVRQRVMFWPY
jgi:hypothetical protein